MGALSVSFYNMIENEFQLQIHSIDSEEAFMAKGTQLRKLTVNTKARIKNIHADGELGRRIRDMGLVPGTEITVVGRAPLHDPVALRLMDFTLTLRNREADHITVDILEA